MKKGFGFFLIVFFLGYLAGCGVKGSLYFPDTDNGQEKITSLNK